MEYVWEVHEVVGELELKSGKGAMRLRTWELDAARATPAASYDWLVGSLPQSAGPRTHSSLPANSLSLCLSVLQVNEAQLALHLLSCLSWQSCPCGRKLHVTPLMHFGYHTRNNMCNSEMPVHPFPGS